MSDGRKATRVLNYLAKQSSETVLRILDPFLDDYMLALIYDEQKELGNV